MTEKGVEFKGGSLHDSFGGSDEHLALLELVLQNTGQRGSRDSFDGFGGFGGYGGFGRDALPGPTITSPKLRQGRKGL